MIYNRATPQREGGLRERHKATRRARILAAARELLREDPEAALTTERIAARADVAPATVYNLVGPRDKVWEALAASLMHDLEGRLEAAAAADPLDRARHVVSVTVALFAQDPAVSQRMLREWERSGLVLAPSPLERLREALQAAQDEGLLVAEVDVKALAAVVGSACLGAMHEWAAETIDDDRFAARALLALDVALAAAAADPHRDRLARRLRPRRAGRRRRGRAA